VKSFPDIHIAKGIHELTWDGTTDNGNPLAAGIYFVKISSENQAITKKVIKGR
jgi:flagellar hook assembly protein FlgD